MRAFRSVLEDVHEKRSQHSFHLRPAARGQHWPAPSNVTHGHMRPTSDSYVVPDDISFIDEEGSGKEETDPLHAESVAQDTTLNASETAPLMQQSQGAPETIKPLSQYQIISTFESSL